jgi:hypothetical protein
MLKQNEFVEQFNKEEQKRRRSILRKLKRRPSKAMEKLDEAIEKRRSVDLISRKWIE